MSLVDQVRAAPNDDARLEAIKKADKASGGECVDIIMCFEKGKNQRRLAAYMLSQKCQTITSQQLAGLLQQFAEGPPEEMLEGLQAFAPKLSDRHNKQVITACFPSYTDKEKAEKIIEMTGAPPAGPAGKSAPPPQPGAPPPPPPPGYGQPPPGYAPQGQQAQQPYPQAPAYGAPPQPPPPMMVQAPQQPATVVMAAPPPPPVYVQPTPMGYGGYGPAYGQGYGHGHTSVYHHDGHHGQHYEYGHHGGGHYGGHHGGGHHGGGHHGDCAIQ